MTAPRDEARAPLRVAVVNDYEIVVSGVAAMLEPHQARIRIVRLAGSTEIGDETDIVLYDPFGQPDPLTHLRALLETTHAKIVLFSWQLESRFVSDALSLGVSAALPKSVAGHVLVSVLEQVHDQTYDGVASAPTEPGVTPSSLASEPGSPGSPGSSGWPGREAGLTPRESEILALIAQGISNEQVSRTAYIGINSVKSHIRSTYRKIGVTTRAQAIVWALTNGFTITPPP